LTSAAIEKPGQYLTFWFEIPGHPPVKRSYSISSAPNGETYRISVKREPQGHCAFHDHNPLFSLPSGREQ
tara:strand:- start:113396 stop:113605 length:210 start_codon:yes stop_codon:yes gene_type:complete